MSENLTTITTTEVPAEERSLEVITTEILLYKQQAGTAILEIGNRLIEAKAQLQHGEWGTWLAEKVDFSEATAKRFMRLAKEYANRSTVTDLGSSKALVLLALPASERDEFIDEKHSVNGEEKTVAEMSKRELEKVIRERDEARKEAEAVRRDMEEQLEEQRTVYDTDMADAEAKLQEAEQAASKLAEKLKKMEGELDEMRTAPQEVAVEKVVDEDAIREATDKAKKEKEEELQKQMDKLIAEKKKADDAKAAAEKKLADLKMSQEEETATLRREKEIVEEQMKTVQKKLATASSSEITIFKLHFEQCQATINKMRDCITNMESAGKGDDAEKLKRAFVAMLNAAKGAME